VPNKKPSQGNTAGARKMNGLVKKRRSGNIEFNTCKKPNPLLPLSLK